MRVMRRNTRTGKIRRSYIARYKEVGKDGIVADKKPTLGPVSGPDAVKFDDAKARAYELYQSSVAKRKAGAEAVRTLKAAYDDYLTVRKANIAPDTVSGYDARIGLVKDWFDLPLTEITDEMLSERYLKIYATKQRTAKMWAAVMHAIFAREFKARRLKYNAVALLADEQKIYAKSENREPTFIREHQMPVFWQSIHTRLHPCARDYLLVMLFTGFRESIAGSLSWENYDFKTRTYRVQAQARGNKKKKTFYFPIPAYVAESVFERRAAEQRMKYDGNLGNWVIESYKRRGKSYKDARGSFRAILNDTGIDLSDHDLRDTFATIARRVTGDTLLVSRLLTHNLQAADYDKLSTTTDYIGVEDDEFRAAIEKVAAGILSAAKAVKQPEVA